MSRDTFYRYKAAVEEGGVEALFERTRRKPNLANRVGEATEQAVIKSALEFPAYGQARTSNELRKQGVPRLLAPPEWALRLAARRPPNVVTVALANKTARTIWALLAHDRAYQTNFNSQPV